jgi:molybdenum cofactor cytidylyltransferase
MNKLLIPIEGVPMVRRAAETLLDGGVDSVVAVTGHETPAVMATLDGLPIRFVHNPHFAEGMAGSLVRGVEALADHAAVVVMLGDMPWIPADVVRRLIEAFRAGGPGAICVPVHDGRRGNPVLWPKRYFDSILALTGDQGARGLLDRFAEHVVTVPVESDGVLRDLDDPASFVM